MSYTFLQLCQRLCQEVSGSGNGPTAVTAQTGEYRRFVNWIAQADETIQRARDNWRFMRRGFTVQTVAEQAAYSYTACTDIVTGVPIANFREWDIDLFNSYLTAGGVGGERPLSFLDYEIWYSIYNTGVQTSSAPVQVAVLNNRSFSLGPKPNDIYTVSGEYIMSVTTMTASDDVPVYPEEFHLLPMWMAMIRHGVYTGSPELIDLGRIESTRMMYDMERTQLPGLTFEEASA